MTDPRITPVSFAPAKPSFNAIRSARRGMENRRSDLDFTRDRGVKVVRTTGRVQIIRSGESTVEVKFPCTYAERPSFYSGFELSKFQPLRGGFLPMCSVGVARWNTVEKVPGIFHYLGAVLTIVTWNSPLYVWVQWHVEGRAFQNPITGLETSDPYSQNPYTSLG